MRAYILGVFVVLAAAGSCAAKEKAPPPTPTPSTEDQKTFYALGLTISRNLGTFHLTPEELAFVQAGLTDGVTGQPPKVDLQAYGPLVQEMAKARYLAVVEAERKAGEPFLAAAAAEPGAITTPSGLVYREITPGTGASPKVTDRVRVQFTGRLRDGTVFDSSAERGKPDELVPNQAFACWTEGLIKMKVGGKSKFTCPATSAYGSRGLVPKIAPGAALSLEVELLEIVEEAPKSEKEAPPNG
jgi:FKBP-type peptidyl-prolyl cis-trans isomerase